MEPKIIFEDESLVVVDKPAGMVVNKAQSVKDVTVQEWFAPKLKSQNSKLKSDEEFVQKGGVVHRLDKDTSGILILAKTPETYEKLKDQFLNRRTQKTYIALVNGKMQPAAGVASLPVVRNPRNKTKFTVGEDKSRTAITEWRTIRRFAKDRYSLVELTPVTGRTHQLRVHLAYLGFPIVGDSLYDHRKRAIQTKEWCPRLFLHAGTLVITHPVSGQIMKFEAELPAELKAVIEKGIFATLS
ncbi:MAG: Pseudouridine synthase [Candidatus Amesbacteria bacterium GW2011_GWB1_47_19]|nr:MAG: Pseudouridine synthase [Candidatus Amesbacteria bacterium GW2011_GWA1_44_24]KKU31589.1 MAG: Pseudouridine synthase [Candidatus Amesbacteria bacterium GW2011_GWC1_46_24]KKU67362.1 MAG: Pseudouridine synthase [Candidatus Amesbacteria bacterium GW2011_GWB1_47_19]OGD05223.1 MAG: hypothetical protein A2379_04420 [Candidatus Amesbacteria bacterium RIFOXYB1_FULL_47_13]HBC72588.1 RluA family pseudouridine synthase [Candidatus Amesbacteria bacterium]